MSTIRLSLQQSAAWGSLCLAYGLALHAGLLPPETISWSLIGIGAGSLGYIAAAWRKGS